MGTELYLSLTCEPVVFISGVSGPVVMDENADREPDYWLWHMAASGDQFQVWTEVRMTAPAGQVSFSCFY